MNTISIKKVQPQDITKLHEISRQTFSEAFSYSTSEENMNSYLSEKLTLEKITSERNNPNSEFYFAVIGEKIAGYLKINFGEAQSDLQDNQALEIERIYVLKDFIGQKVGQALYTKAYDIAVYNHLDYIWLGVWKENINAIKFYKRNGLEPFDKHTFAIGDDIQTDLLMKVNLRSNQ